jgi:hypothetical protein
MASCRACRWSGRKDDLVVMPVKHELGSNEEILISMYRRWREVFGKSAKDIARFLLEWGFITAREEGGKLRMDPKLLARYVSAAASHSLAAILEERQKLEQEKVHEA